MHQGWCTVKQRPSLTFFVTISKGSIYSPDRHKHEYQGYLRMLTFKSRPVEIGLFLKMHKRHEEDKARCSKTIAM